MREAGYFYLNGSDGERLFVDVRNGLVSYRARAKADQDYLVELVGIIPATTGTSVLLCANDDIAVPMRGFVTDNLGAVAIDCRTLAHGRVALMHPDHRRCVGVTPLVHLVGSRVSYALPSPPKEWEAFTMQMVPATAIRRFPKAVASASSLISRPTAASICDALMHCRDDATRACATAAIAFLPAGELARFGQLILSEPACLSAIQDANPDDPWSWRVLPNLIQWQRLRAVRDGGREKAAPAGSQTDGAFGLRRLTIDRSYDFLATAGFAGELTSIGHACNTYARAAIEPRRGLCVLATARNEGAYFLEWIAYHRSIGVEHFFIYTNDNEDGSGELLAALASNGVITLIENQVGQGEIAQHKAYGHALSVLPEILDYKWALIIDLDEFFVFNPAMFTSVDDFLQWHDRQEVDAISINWTFVGSTGQARWSDTPLSERNTKLLSQNQVGHGHRLIKSFSKPARVIHSEPHFPMTDTKRELVQRHANGALYAYHHPPEGIVGNRSFSDVVDTSHASIYHYIYKSAEEYLWRNSRNRGNLANLVHRDGIRFVQDDECRSYLVQERAADLPADVQMQSCRKQQRAVIETLRVLPGVERGYQAMIRQFQARLASVRDYYEVQLQAGALTDDVRQLLAWAEFAQPQTAAL